MIQCKKIQYKTKTKDKNVFHKKAVKKESESYAPNVKA